MKPWFSMLDWNSCSTLNEFFFAFTELDKYADYTFDNEIFIRITTGKMASSYHACPYEMNIQYPNGNIKTIPRLNKHNLILEMNKLDKKPIMKIIRFKDWDCTLEYAQYGNKRTAITLLGTGEELGEPIAVATVNMPDDILEEDEIYIKDYAENSGMEEALLNAGVIGPSLGFVVSGHIMIGKHKLLITKEDYGR